MDNKPINVFISQPMNGRSLNEIVDERAKILDDLYIALGLPDSRELNIVNPIERDIKTDGERFEFLGYSVDNPPRVWWLGEAIQEMAAADIFVFGPDWHYARGCNVEKVVYENYFRPSRYKFMLDYSVPGFYYIGKSIVEALDLPYERYTSYTSYGHVSYGFSWPPRKGWFVN